MKKLSLAIFYIASAYASDLTYISNTADIKTLETLYQKYKQELLINDERVYLIPSDCRLDRYFGGASELEVKLTKRPEQTEEIIITQEVFEAKSEDAIKEKIETQKSIALIEGKVSKEFLLDKEGRGFGGASEIPIDYSFQQVQVQNIYMRKIETKVPASQKPLEKTESAKETYKHPTCQISDSGSGYVLENIKDAKLYTPRGFEEIKNSNISFR